MWYSFPVNLRKKFICLNFWELLNSWKLSLVYWYSCLHLYCYIHNVLVDASFGLWWTELETIYPHGSNKRFGSKFRVGSWVQDETPEEGRRTHRPKRCECNNKNEDNSLNTLNHKKERFVLQYVALPKERCFCWSSKYVLTLRCPSNQLALFESNQVSFQLLNDEITCVWCFDFFLSVTIYIFEYWDRW